MGLEGVWIKINPDCRGYTDAFKCSECGSHIELRVFDTECDYPYCPWCRCEMVDTIEEAVQGDA